MRWILYFLLLAAFPSVAQYTAYDSIKSSELSFEEKIVWIDQLLEKGDPRQLAECFHDYAKFLYRNGQLEKCIQASQQAVAIRDSLSLSEPLKQSLFNLGFFYRKAVRYESSIKAYKKIIALGSEDRLQGKAHAELGTLYSLLGDFHFSLVQHQKANEIFTEVNDLRSLYKNKLEITRAYSAMDRVLFADQILTTLEMVDSLGGFTEIDTRDQVIRWQRSAAVFDELGNYKMAISHYNQSLEVIKNSSSHPSLQHISLNNLAISERKSGAMNDAKRHLTEALNLAESPEELGTVYNNLGDWFLQMKMMDSARHYYEDAISQLIAGRSTEVFTISFHAIEHSPFKLQVLEGLKSLSEYWWQDYQTTKARKSLEENLSYLLYADSLLTSLQNSSKEYLSKVFWRSRASDVYIKGLRNCHASGDYELAYYFLERNKAMLLLENLSKRKAQALAAVPKESVEKDDQLMEEIAQKEVSLFLDPSDSKEKRASLIDLKLAYQRFQDSIYLAYPEYQKFQRQLNIKTWQTHINEISQTNQASYQFIFKDNLGFGLFQSGDTILVTHLEVQRIDSLVKIYQPLLTRPLQTKSDLNLLQGISNALFKELFPTSISGKLKDKHLIISPDGPLYDLNFESLATFPGEDRFPASFLINQCEISYVYSFSHLDFIRQATPHNPQQISFFAPGSYQADDLPALPASLSEVLEINNLMEASLFSEENCTKANFLNVLPESKLVHVAAHASLDPQLEPKVHFYDDAISATELYATKNNAELIVLNACGTSKGKILEGEGVMSLARAFIYAGGEGVISTLGNVNDGVSKHIMLSFYRHLDGGLSISRALRKAKLEYLNNSNGSELSPYYWSAYVLIGDYEKTREPAVNTIFALLIGLMGLFVIWWLGKSLSGL